MVTYVDKVIYSIVNHMSLALSVRIMTGIRHEGRQNFGDQRTDVHKKLCIVLVDLYLV